MADADHHRGWRISASAKTATLRDRFLLADLLAPINPRQAVHWADALIDEFGSLAHALSGTRVRMLRAVGGTEAPVVALRAHRRAALYAFRSKLLDRPIIAVPNDLIRYLHLQLAYQQNEEFRVLYLDSARRLLAEEVMARGGIDNCHIEPRTVIARALELGAKGMYIVHNHPSGNPMPSEQDRRVTQRIANASWCMGLTLYDHVIVARDGDHIFSVQPVNWEI